MMERIADVFWRKEGPTWLVLMATFACWAGLMAFHENLPWYSLAIFGGIIVALHSSLVHESVHCLRCVPKWFREFLFFLPLGVLFPYHVYFRDHTTHHRDAYLTDPSHDPESFYYGEDDWQRQGPVMKMVMIANQTFAGRMILGPFIVIVRLVRGEVSRLLNRDGSNLGALTFHLAGLAVLFWVVISWAGMPWWQYIVFIAYPGLALSLIRSFIEHRCAEDVDHRTAIVESGLFFGLLFLNNNLHVVHHRHPAMKWYKIPAYYRQHRQELQEGNQGFVFRGYGEIIRHYLFKPTFVPVHKI
ncbi:MAG: fatty acid desaturase [Rhodospirillales bacterium]|nr:fatty acid desaturase [Rhodospirillales bacterium]